MSNISQPASKNITYLPDLGTKNLEQREAELAKSARSEPITLIIPTLSDEYDGEKLEVISNILRQVGEAKYISRLIVGLDKADEIQYQNVKDLLKELLPETESVVLWNHGPRMEAVDDYLREKGQLPVERSEWGKGYNIFYCFMYALATSKYQNGAIGLVDGDIKTFDRQMVANLFAPVSMGFDFAKGHYSRVTDDNYLGGRVNRLFVAPFLDSMMQQYGQSEYLKFMRDFKYTISGEFAMNENTAGDLQIAPDWSLEVATLSEMKRMNANCADVEVARIYDHKHQDVSLEDPQKGLNRMATEIAKSLFRKLAVEGVEKGTISRDTVRELQAKYHNAARAMRQSQKMLAEFNGLNFNNAQESAKVDLFANQIMEAFEAYEQRSKGLQYFPSINDVMHSVPEAQQMIIDAVHEDNDGYKPSAQFKCSAPLNGNGSGNGASAPFPGVPGGGGVAFAPNFN